MKAKRVNSIGTEGDADSLRVTIAGDGEFRYKAFRLDNPARLVIDLEGVRNSVKKSSIDVNNGAIQRVRQGRSELQRLGAQVVFKPFDIEQLLNAIQCFWPAPESVPRNCAS